MNTKYKNGTIVLLVVCVTIIFAVFGLKTAKVNDLVFTELKNERAASLTEDEGVNSNVASSTAVKEINTLPPQESSKESPIGDSLVPSVAPVGSSLDNHMALTVGALRLETTRGWGYRRTENSLVSPYFEPYTGNELCTEVHGAKNGSVIVLSSVTSSVGEKIKTPEDYIDFVLKYSSDMTGIVKYGKTLIDDYLFSYQYVEVSGCGLAVYYRAIKDNQELKIFAYSTNKPNGNSFEEIDSMVKTVTIN